MAERRLRQFMIPGELLASLSPAEEETSLLEDMGWFDTLLRERGLIPMSAKQVGMWLHDFNDVITVRYQDASFPVTRFGDRVPWFPIRKEELGLD